MDLKQFSPYYFIATVTVGAGAENNAAEPKEMNLLIDTRNQISIVFD